MKRLQLLLSEILASLRYAEALKATPASDRIGPGLQAVKLPICWIRGHTWPALTGAFEICAFRAQWCDRCGEEVAGRVAWSQLEPEPAIDGEDLPWWGMDLAGEREGCDQ